MKLGDSSEIRSLVESVLTALAAQRTVVNENFSLPLNSLTPVSADMEVTARKF